MPQTILEQRVPARLPTAVHEKIAEAAQFVGARLNQFPLEEERIIKLSTASSEALFAMMENPPEPNGYLKQAMQRRRDTLCRR